MAYAELMTTPSTKPGRKYPDTMVQTTWGEKELIKQVPGARWDPDHKMWICPTSWSTCKILRGVFRETLQIGQLLSEWGYAHLKEIELPMYLREKHIMPPDEKLVVLLGLYDFQNIGSRWLGHTPDALLGDEMGTGKTIQALAGMHYASANSSLPAIVICPNGTRTGWERETKKWLQAAHPYVLKGSSNQRMKMLADAANDPQALVIINWESVRLMSRLASYGSVRLNRCVECDPTHGDSRLTASRCEVHPKILNKIPFRTVIVDEAHRMKDPISKQTRAVWAVQHGETVERRWSMTGTPIANDPTDLWSIMHGVAPYDFPTKGKFVDRYALQAFSAYGGLNVVGINPLNKKEFEEIFHPHFRRMLKDIVAPQLPKKVYVKREVEMSTKQRKAYAELTDRLVTELANGDILAVQNNLVLRTRQIQLSSAYCEINEDGDVRLSDPSPKLDEMEEILDELGDKPVVIAAMHKQLIDLAAKRLTKKGISFGLYTGGIAQWERDRALDLFQEGQTRVLLFTVAAGGVGLTMTRADTILFLQRSWSMIENLQAEDRVHRIGSEIHESITVIDLVTKDSAEDEVLFPRYYEKLEMLEEITQDRARRAAAGLDYSDLDMQVQEILGSSLL